jgi:parallel beta-helix repeat protein
MSTLINHHSRAFGAIALTVLAVSCPASNHNQNNSDSTHQGNRAILAPVPAPHCEGVTLTPSDTIQTEIDNHPGKTTFCLRNGIYPINTLASKSGLEAKNGDNFYGQSIAKTILTGNNSAPYAFNGTLNGASNVTISTMTIENFNSPHLQGAIMAALPSATATAPSGWKMTDLTVKNNTETGISVGDDDVVNHDTITNNGNTGIGSGNQENLAGNFPFTNGVVIENNVINNNGFVDHTDSAGAKLLWLKNAHFINNDVFDNYGPGLWCDAYCSYVYYTGNKVTNNLFAGIFPEISNHVTITGNTITGNGVNVCSGKGIAPFCPSAGISISSSNYVTVSNNKVIGNRDSVIAYNGHVQPGAPEVSNIDVSDNLMGAGNTGIDIATYNAAPQPDALSTSYWTKNTYADDTVTYYWGSPLNASAWQALQSSPRATVAAQQG